MSCNAKKDPNGTWRIQYRWTDWTGTKKKSQKRGFKTKKEAEEWYAHFRLQQSSDPTMTLADFWEIYKAIGVFTIKEMAIPTFIYWLPCVHLRKIIPGEIKRSKTGRLLGIRMEIL